MEEEIHFEPLPAERVEYKPPPHQEAKDTGWIGVAVIRLLSLLIVGGAVYYSTEGIVVMLVLFILVVPVEKIFPRHRGQKVRRPLYKLDISYAMSSPPVSYTHLTLPTILRV